jgi:hypothetical protein
VFPSGLRQEPAGVPFDKLITVENEQSCPAFHREVMRASLKLNSGSLVSAEFVKPRIADKSPSTIYALLDRARYKSALFEDSDTAGQTRCPR